MAFYRFQTTYEELKPGTIRLAVGTKRPRFQTTYEELKLLTMT